jgi:hypothetical protein
MSLAGFELLAAATSGTAVPQTLACLLSLAALWYFFQDQRTCLQCGGSGAHRRDCPLAKDPENDEG